MTEETKCVSHRWFCLWNILPPTGIFCHCQTQYLARPPTPSLLPPFWFRLQSKANRQFVYLQQIFSHLGHSRREQGTLACPLCPQHISRACKQLLLTADFCYGFLCYGWISYEPRRTGRMARVLDFPSGDHEFEFMLGLHPPCQHKTWYGVTFTSRPDRGCG